jgi:hypothetical protein
LAKEVYPLSPKQVFSLSRARIIIMFLNARLRKK